MQLANGQRGSLTIANLPEEVAKYLGCHPAIVFLGHDELLKISTKHPEIAREELQSLPFMIKEGFYIKDNKRKNCVSVFYRMPYTQTLYTAGIKSAENGSEVWVATFYKTNAKYARRRVKTHGSLHGLPCF